ncbi:hypothetical protein HK101_007679 [Irineochytrium annulatum]|nr:hypothetical protein HK101_007679 [Irineochytrium annulatum]
MVLVGELCNVAAYAFSPAILVTPLGAVSVVVSAILSDLLLKEKLNFSAKIGCAQCMLGAVLLVINAPASNTTTTLKSFWTLAGSWIFLVYFAVNMIALLLLVFLAAPRWGERWPLIYISICSILGSFVVVSMQGLGSAIVYTASHPDDNQFKDWTMYPLLVMVVLSGVMQINYLNKALNIFSTAIVTPVYYVFFTTATLLCSAILLRDFMFDTVVNGVSALVGFCVIVGGVALLFAYSLQLAKEDQMSAQAVAAGAGGPLSPGSGLDELGAINKGLPGIPVGGSLQRGVGNYGRPISSTEYANSLNLPHRSDNRLSTNSIAIDLVADPGIFAPRTNTLTSITSSDARGRHADEVRMYERGAPAVAPSAVTVHGGSAGPYQGHQHAQQQAQELGGGGGAPRIGRYRKDSEASQAGLLGMAAPIAGSEEEGGKAGSYY